MLRIAMSYSHTCYAGMTGTGTQPCDLTSIKEGDISSLRQAIPYMSLKERSALTIPCNGTWEASFPHTKVVPADIGDGVYQGGPVSSKCRREAGEEILQNGRSPLQESMDVLPLRYSFTRVRTLWKAIALDNRHAREMLRKHAASQQTGHTCADHYGVLTAQSTLRILNDYGFQYNSYPLQL